MPLASTSAAARVIAAGSLPATNPMRKCTSPPGVREWIEARLMPCCSNTFNEPADLRQVHRQRVALGQIGQNRPTRSNV